MLKKIVTVVSTGEDSARDFLLIDAVEAQTFVEIAKADLPRPTRDRTRLAQDALAIVDRLLSELPLESVFRKTIEFERARLKAAAVRENVEDRSA